VSPALRLACAAVTQQHQRGRGDGGAGLAAGDELRDLIQRDPVDALGFEAAGGSPRWLARRVQNTWFTESDSPLAASSMAYLPDARKSWPRFSQNVRR